MLETLFWFSYAQKDFLVIRMPSIAIVITITSSQTKITLHKALLSTNPICIPEKVYVGLCYAFGTQDIKVAYISFENML